MAKRFSGGFYRFSHNEAGHQVAGDSYWLTRAKKNLRWKTVRNLGPGGELVELSLKAARIRNPSLPKTMLARAIRYQVKGYQPQTLLTSLIDAALTPSATCVGLLKTAV